MNEKLKKMQMRSLIATCISLLICSTLLLTKNAFDIPLWLWTVGCIVALAGVVYGGALAFRMIIMLRRGR